MEPDFHLNSGQLPSDWQTQLADRGYAIIEGDGETLLLTTMPLPAPAKVQPLTIEEATSALLEMLTNGATLGGPWQQFDSEDADIATDGILAFELGEPEADPTADPEAEPGDGMEASLSIQASQAIQAQVVEMTTNRIRELNAIRASRLGASFYSGNAADIRASELFHRALQDDMDPDTFAQMLNVELTILGF